VVKKETFLRLQTGSNYSIIAVEAKEKRGGGFFMQF